MLGCPKVWCGVVEIRANLIFVDLQLDNRISVNSTNDKQIILIPRLLESSAAQCLGCLGFRRVRTTSTYEQDGNSIRFGSIGGKSQVAHTLNTRQLRHLVALRRPEQESAKQNINSQINDRFRSFPSLSLLEHY